MIHHAARRVMDRALSLANSIFSAAIADNIPDLHVSIQIDAAQPIGPWIPVWRFFGYDEANFTYMHDGRRLLSELSRSSAAAGFHSLSSPADQRRRQRRNSNGVPPTPTPRMPRGNPVYDWTITDRIFDTYVERGLKPYAQIGFMPKALSQRPDLYPTTFDPDKPRRRRCGAGLSAQGLRQMARTRL